MPNRSVDQLIKDKRESKESLSTELNFSKKKPLLGIFLDKQMPKGEAANVKFILEGLKFLNIEVVVLADSDLELFMDDAIILPYSRTNRKKLLEAADIALAFKFSDVEEMLINGIIPISKERKEIIDYNPNHECGNAFVYKSDSPWEVFAALVRATETFRFPYDWKHIVREGLSAVGSLV